MYGNDDKEQEVASISERARKPYYIVLPTKCFTTTTPPPPPNTGSALKQNKTKRFLRKIESNIICGVFVISASFLPNQLQTGSDIRKFCFRDSRSWCLKRKV